MRENWNRQDHMFERGGLIERSGKEKVRFTRRHRTGHERDERGIGGMQDEEKRWWISGILLNCRH